MTRKIPHYLKYDFRLSSINRLLYSVIRARSSSVFLLQLNVTPFKYSLYLLAITHRLPEFSCAVSDIKNFIKSTRLDGCSLD